MDCVKHVLERFLVGNRWHGELDVWMALEPIVNGDVTAIGWHDRVERFAVEIFQFVDFAVFRNDEVHEEVIVWLGE